MSSEIGYTPGPAPRNLTYDLTEWDIPRRFSSDAVIAASMAHPNTDAIFHDIARLSVSEDWQDRIRAEALRAVAEKRITLPDQFPCIHDANSNHAPNRVWVVSPDVDMLETLLPLYRELWDSYDSKWPERPAAQSRDFTFGYVDGLSPRGVYRPGTTAAQVIGHTMLTHDGMYRSAPAHLRAMHPLHEQWVAQKQL